MQQPLSNVALRRVTTASGRFMRAICVVNASPSAEVCAFVEDRLLTIKVGEWMRRIGVNPNLLSSERREASP